MPTPSCNATITSGWLQRTRVTSGLTLIGATAKNNRGEVLQAHELSGAIALQERKYDQALEELRQGNQQDPYTLYRIGLAYQGKGDQARAADFFRRAADQHTLPTLNYAFVRAKAKKMKA
jgi:tetratricopeptide (TPR) repeat protein